MAKILVIDESAAMRRLLRFMLKGHEVIEARFGLEAIRVQDQGPFDLTICDLAVPDMAASDLYRQLVDDGYQGRVLFLAAQLDITPRDRFGTRLPILNKPVEAEMLSRRVEALLEAPSQTWDVK